MNREQITALSTIAVSVGSVAIFAATRMKARNYIWNTKVEKKRNPITVIATLANTLSA